MLANILTTCYTGISNILNAIFNVSVEESSHKSKLAVIATIAAIIIGLSALVSIWGAIAVANIALMAFIIYRSTWVYGTSIKEHISDNTYFGYIAITIVCAVVSFFVALVVSAADPFVSPLTPALVYLGTIYGTRYFFVNSDTINVINARITRKYGSSAQAEAFIVKTRIDVLWQTLFGLNEDDKKRLSYTWTVSVLILVVSFFIYLPATAIFDGNIIKDSIIAATAWCIAGTLIMRIAHHVEEEAIDSDGAMYFLALLTAIIALVLSILAYDSVEELPFYSIIMAIPAVIIWGVGFYLCTFNERFDDATFAMNEFKATKTQNQPSDSGGVSMDD